MILSVRTFVIASRSWVHDMLYLRDPDVLFLVVVDHPVVVVPEQSVHIRFSAFLLLNDIALMPYSENVYI